MTMVNVVRTLLRFQAFLLVAVLLLPLNFAVAQMPGVGGIQDILRGQAGSLTGIPSVTPRPPLGSDMGALPQPLRNNTPMQRFQCRFDKSSLPGHEETGIRELGQVGHAGQVPQQQFGQMQLPGQVGQILYVPNDFELYVEAQTGRQLCRFGHQATYDLSSFFEPPPLAMVPEDYVLGPGDEVFVRLWGSIELDTALVLDRSGQVVIPRVGPVRLGGVRYGAASEMVRQATRRLFSDFNVSVSLGRLRGVRVYVTGFADRPGAYNVSNLSSLSSIVMAAGGPSRAGSYRNIELKRGGKVISQFDLYELLLKGNKSSDRPLLSEDVIHFGPIGNQVAVLGGVNNSAVFEIKPGETVDDLVAMAGGFSPGASVGAIHRLSIDQRELGFKELPKNEMKTAALRNGDIFISKNDSRFRSATDRSSRRVVVSGQVKNPGEYFLPPMATLKDAIQMAGGYVSGAYPYGIQLLRTSVRAQQEATLERVLRELDRQVVASSTIRPLNAEEARLLQVRAEMSRSLVERLQNLKPDGRLALPIAPSSSELPIVELEHGDQITVPTIPAFVGVFGSVVNGGTYLFRSNGRVSDYLSAAGGIRKGAEVDESFVIRANGQAEKFRPNGVSFLGLGSAKRIEQQIYPGDNIIVPEDMAKTTFYREVSTWSTLIYQLGLGAAALKVLTQ